MKILAGFVAGWLVSVPVFLYFHTEPETDLVKLQVEMLAYRHCMENAGKLRCEMTPQDLIRYFDLEREVGYPICDIGKFEKATKGPARFEEIPK